MKYLVVSFILFFCTLQTFGQQEYFVYLQTDNNQAFYLRVNNNVFSSTAGGYLILSKLADSTASVTIGFPKNVFAEQQFNIPVNHKDAGYLVKNFGDKGWGLFNLQTMAVIMNNNPPEEKKSPEITISKKNDAFSLLLANAVNDTSVLYTVSKPPKPAPPPPAIADEKKTDTAALVIKDLPGQDTVALVKNIPEKKDSNLVTKNSTKPSADSNNKDVPVKDTAVMVKNLPGKKNSNLVTKNSTKLPADRNKKDLPAKDTVALVTAPEKNKKPATDTIAIAKNTVPPPASKDTTKSVTSKIKQFFKGRSSSKPKKDTIIIAGNNTSPATAVAKNKNERRDTIIMMKGRVLEDSKPVVKNTTIQKASKPLPDRKKDSLQLVKNDKAAKKTEEKTIAPPNNSRVVAVRDNIAKHDTLANKAVSKKDTAAVLVKNNSTARKPREKTNIPANNLPPVAVQNNVDKRDTLINNAAIKKDTVASLVNNNKAAKKKPEEKTNTTVNNLPPVAVENNINKDNTPANNASVKKDTATALVKNEVTKPATTDTVGTAPLKRQRPLINRAAEFLTDTSYIAVFIDESKDKFDTIRISIPFKEEAAFAKQEKPVTKESLTPVITETHTAPVVKKDTTAADKAAKDSTTVAGTPPPAAPVKKDSVPVITQQATTTIVKQDDAAPALADSAKTKQGQPPVVNTDCKDTASDSDIDKLRIKMMLANSDEDRLAIAKKVYRLKCFSVKQVRALSELFKNDEGKYQWLDAVYPFVSDNGNFSSLAEILKDNYYLNRFRAMLRN